jgi:CRP/FNR family cyclic AMP-dependent transcriptional regulator
MSPSIASQLGSHPLFTSLPPAALERIATCTSQVAFQAGDLILSEGGTAQVFYLLRQGRVALSAHAPGKGHLLVQTLGPGETLGLSWLFPPFLWQFDARAVEPVEALAIEGPCLRDKLEGEPGLGYELLKRFTPVVLERLQQTRLRLLDLYGNRASGNGHDLRLP